MIPAASRIRYSILIIALAVCVHPAGAGPRAAAPAAGLDPHRGKIPARISTSGPAVALSANQLAQLAAKRAALVQGHADAETPIAKPAPVSTVPASDPGARLASPLGAAATPGRSIQPIVHRASSTPAAGARAPGRTASDPHALDAVRAALGPEAARRVGLVKAGDRLWTGAGRAPRQEVRP